MEMNPYPSTSSHIAESQTVAPHTTSVRAEAWRGFKFGAKITGVVMSLILALMGLVMLCMSIYAVVVTRGAILSEVSYLQIAKDIVHSIFGVLLMSFYGGIAGGIIMSLAAFIRRRRAKNANSKTK